MALLTRLFYVVATLLLLAALPARAGESLQLYEQEIKAGLLYNFLKYTDWPAERMADPSAPLSVCIFGDDPISGYLKPMAGRTVNQRSITLRTIRAAPEAAACHLLFISPQEKGGLASLLSLVKGRGVLTVSDFKGFASAGGMIEFGRRDNRISADLNMEAVRGGGLQVGDRLLKLVTVIHPEEEP